jgi:hypothetical protein
MTVLNRRSLLVGSAATLLAGKSYAQDDKPLLIMAGHDF